MAPARMTMARPRACLLTQPRRVCQLPNYSITYFLNDGSLSGARILRLEKRRHAVGGSKPFVGEALDAFPFIGFGCIQVALRVGSDAVHALELAGAMSRGPPHA